MSCIQFGILNIYLLIIVLFPLSKHFFNLLIKLRNRDNLPTNIIYEIFIKYLSMILAGNIYLITKLLSRTQNDKNLKQKINDLKSLSNEVENDPNISINIYQSIELQNLKQKKNQSIYQFLFMILIAYTHLAGILVNCIFKNEISFFEREKNLPTQLLLNLVILFIFLLIAVFSNIFLGFHLYKHQYCSLIIILLCLIIFIIESYESATIKDCFTDFIFVFIYEIFYSLSDVLGKKYLDKYLDGVYLFLFKFGMVISIPYLIYDLIAYLSKANDKYHGLIRGCFKEFPFIDSLLDLGFNFLNNLGIWLTIFYFSPLHVIIYMILDNFFGIIFMTFSNKAAYKNYQKITFYILYPILIFFLLVFNEIFIFNFWNLNYNTKYYMKKREEEENEKMKDNERDSNRTSNSSLYDEELKIPKKKIEMEEILIPTTN